MRGFLENFVVALVRCSRARGLCSMVVHARHIFKGKKRRIALATNTCPYPLVSQPGSRFGGHGFPCKLYSDGGKRLQSTGGERLEGLCEATHASIEVAVMLRPSRRCSCMRRIHNVSEDEAKDTTEGLCGVDLTAVVGRLHRGGG